MNHKNETNLIQTDPLKVLFIKKLTFYGSFGGGPLHSNRSVVSNHILSIATLVLTEQTASLITWLMTQKNLKNVVSDV